MAEARPGRWRSRRARAMTSIWLTDPVHGRQRDHRVVAHDPFGHLTQLHLGVRMGAVAECGDGLALVVVTHRADEQREATSGIVSNRSQHLGDVERCRTQPDQPDLSCHGADTSRASFPSWLGCGATRGMDKRSQPE